MSRDSSSGSGRPTAAGGRWLELTVTAAPEAVEAVGAILARHVPGGISLEPTALLVDEALGSIPDPTRPVIVRGYLPTADPAADTAVEAVRRDLGHLQAFGLGEIGEPTVTVVEEGDWATAWKAHLPVVRVGRRLVVRPTWRRHRRRPDEVVIVIDPGMAFGTGLHPTTRLCLRALEDLADAGALGSASRVLDLGSGSGILAIAAAKLGAASVLALDVDPIAVDATAANARRNRLAARIEARRGSLPSGASPFDVVVANLVASILVELASSLAAELAPGGALVVSGIVADRAAEVEAALARAGLELVGRLEEGDWVAERWHRPRRAEPGHASLPGAVNVPSRCG